MTDWPYVHVESVGPGRRLLLKQKGPWLFEGEERFPTLDGIQQRVQIGEFEEFGRGLVIDGATQLAEAIDAAYTTALVFPAALLADSRRRWLILGGGDGAAAREALRFRDTESVQLVDISRLVIDVTQKLIPSFWAGCQHDQRLDICTCDAWEIRRGTACGPRPIPPRGMSSSSPCRPLWCTGWLERDVPQAGRTAPVLPGGADGAPGRLWLALQQVLESSERSVGRTWHVLPTRRRLAIRVSHLLPGVLILMAVEAQQFPVAPVGWVVVMVMVPMMDREFAQLCAAKFAPTPRTEPGIHLERLGAIGLLPLRLVAPRLGNNLILLVDI